MGMEKYDEIAQLIDEARQQYTQFSGGKKVAATRARKALQQIRTLAQECRVDIQQARNEDK